MKNNATRTIRSEEITIDVRICAALAANRSGPFSGMWVKIALGLANTKIGVTIIIVPHIFVFFKARIGKNVADGVKFPRACGEG